MKLSAAPLLGFTVGFLWMTTLYVALARKRPSAVNRTFRPLQILSAAALGFSHGSNDAQKTMGVIGLALFSATATGALDNTPGWLGFLYSPQFTIPLWVKLLCATTMAAGTAAGGRRIIRTLGRKVARLQPINGFASDTTSATVLFTAAAFGMPVSTTHAVSTAIMGVGTARSSRAMRWDLVESILWTWILTLPASGLMGYGLTWLLRVAAPGAGILPAAH